MTREEKILSLRPGVNFHAKRIAQTIPRNVATSEDLLGWGWLGAIDAVDQFDENKGVQLNTYASHRIRGRILDYLRSLDPLSRGERRRARQEQCRPASEDADGEASDNQWRVPVVLLSLDSETDKLTFRPENYQVDLTTAVDVRRLLRTSGLTQKERLAVELRYLAELQMKQIGVLLGFGESRASQLVKIAITKMRMNIKMSETPRGLTARERQIAIMLSHGDKVKDVAQKLDLSAKTVEVHKFNLYKKLGVHNLASLTRIVVAEIETHGDVPVG